MTPSRNAAKTEDQQGVGRADDLDVETVGVMPPVVKGSRHEHGDASPAGEEDAERGAKSKDTDRRSTELGYCGQTCIEQSARHR